MRFCKATHVAGFEEVWLSGGADGEVRILHEDLTFDVISLGPGLPASIPMVGPAKAVFFVPFRSLEAAIKVGRNAQCRRIAATRIEIVAII